MLPETIIRGMKHTQACNILIYSNCSIPEANTGRFLSARLACSTKRVPKQPGIHGNSVSKKQCVYVCS